ncbi:MAG: DUF2846 domain-containing protein [Acetobacteraceae bacterium]|jgi:hypothetical protein
MASKRNGGAVRRLGLLLGMIGLAGCAKVEYGALANRSAATALSFRPPTGQSGIYVIRRSELEAAAVAFRVDVDRQSLGKITLVRYLYTTLPPGGHSMSVTRWGQLLESDDYLFNTEPGRNYFFVLQPPGLGGPRVTPVPEELGRQMVTDIAKLRPQEL